MVEEVKKKDLTIKQGNNRLYIGESEEKFEAEITYYPLEEGTIVVNHTFVSETIREKGLAAKIVDTMAQYARDHHLKIIPECPYAKKVLTTNAQYKDVLKQ